MKNIFKTFSLIFLSTLALNSCDDNEEELFIINSETTVAPVISTPENGTTLVLEQLDENNVATTLVWQDAVYSVDTVVNYVVEFAAAGTDFATIVVGAETTNNYTSWTVDQLNTYATTIGLIPFTSGDIDVRVKSYVGTQVESPAYSNIVTLSITSYTSSLPTIAVPGNHQGWDPGTAPLLASSVFGATDYEGYVWLDGSHKFIAPDATGVFAWGNTDWGDDGTFTGVLVEDGESDCTATAGYYLVQVDTDATELTYSETMYTWGLIGSGTANNWDSDQDMTYDSASQTWSVTLDLTAEEIKFRANDAWAWDYGDNSADGSLENGGDNIVVPTAGNYTVVLDLSTPRAYTYTLTLN